MSCYMSIFTLHHFNYFKELYITKFVLDLTATRENVF